MLHLVQVDIESNQGRIRPHSLHENRRRVIRQRIIAQQQRRQLCILCERLENRDCLLISNVVEREVEEAKTLLALQQRAKDASTG